MAAKSLHAYLKRGHKRVSGWLEPGAADLIVALSDQQRRNGIAGGVAEIGVHHGRLFILLYLLGAENEPAVAIDLFSRQELNVDRSGNGNLDRFRKNLRRHADLERLVVHEGDSTRLNSTDLRNLGGGPLRLISIDGGHTPEITAHDLATAEGALVQGGIIILDDCFNQMWPGVADGVFRYFSQPRSILPFGIGAGKVFFCHPEFRQRYIAILRTIEAKAAEREFLGCRVLCLNLAPLSLPEQIGKLNWWRSVRNLPPTRALRWIYHSARGRI